MSGHTKPINDAYNAAQEYIVTLERRNARLLEALEEVRKDINWMLNYRQFLSADSFNYLDAAIAKAKQG